MAGGSGSVGLEAGFQPMMLEFVRSSQRMMEQNRRLIDMMERRMGCG